MPHAMPLQYHFHVVFDVHVHRFHSILLGAGFINLLVYIVHCALCTGRNVYNVSCMQFAFEFIYVSFFQKYPESNE